MGGEQHRTSNIERSIFNNGQDGSAGESNRLGGLLLAPMNQPDLGVGSLAASPYQGSGKRRTEQNIEQRTSNVQCPITAKKAPRERRPTVVDGGMRFNPRWGWELLWVAVPHGSSFLATMG